MSLRSPTNNEIALTLALSHRNGRGHFFDPKSTRCVSFSYPRPLAGEGRVRVMRPFASLFIWLFCRGSAAYGAGIESKPDSQSEWEKITQGAKKEGKLSLYL